MFLVFGFFISFHNYHKIAVYDIPATIDYILELTNQTKLAYAGVSQGGTVILGNIHQFQKKKWIEFDLDVFVFAFAFKVTLSELPEYNDKISVAHLMVITNYYIHYD